MSRVHRNGRRGLGISLLAGAAMAALAAAPAHAEGAKIGLLGGLTGPIAQPMVHIVKAAEFAVKQVNGFTAIERQESLRSCANLGNCRAKCRMIAIQ